MLKMTHFLLLAIVIIVSSCSSLEKQTSKTEKDIEAPSFSIIENNNQNKSQRIAKTAEQNIITQYDQEKQQSKETQESLASREAQEKVIYTNLWDKLPHLYKMSNHSDKSLSSRYKQRIAKEKQWYLDHPKYLYRVSERALPYLYLIVEQLEQRDLPGELALLPIVESAYQPHAYSRGRAAGLWQFIPGTGKHFGLTQNWWYDGRRDIYAATNAALDYLEQLSKKFDNDWLLALASYNAGAGTINKAIKRNKFVNKGTSFWELKLPKETRHYVPKLLALAEIINELKTNKIALLPIKNQPYLELVDCENHIDLAVAAELADISIEDLYKYNSGFNQWATNPEGPHHLLIPVNAVETFKQNLSKADKSDLIRWSQYKIEQGDSLSRIAKKHSVSISALKKANQLKNSRIRAGKYLVIPISNKTSNYYNPEINKRRDKIIAQINSKKRTVYKVKKGDSLWTISRKYRISYRKLAKANRISPLATLSIGQKLIIWKGSNYKTKKSVKYLANKNNNKAKSKNKIINYKVKKGDSLYTIARRHKASINQLAKWNNISKKKYLKLGQKLLIYVN